MNSFSLRIAIIGAGRMGRIRAFSAKVHPLCKVMHVCDISADLAISLGNELNCSSSTEWRSVLERGDIDAVVVATPHKFLTEITAEAIKAQKHVFCEKPLARAGIEAEHLAFSLKELSDVNRSVEKKPVAVVGYTLRHHPAVSEARKLFGAGAIGEPLYIRGRYGHGGRTGYEKEWRGNRELAGGGELVDQGVHLIDLSHCFLGAFSKVSGYVDSYFWHDQMSVRPGVVLPGPDLLRNTLSSRGAVEDNAFMILRTQQNKTAMLHASWTQWKNMFSFEVFGTAGFLVMEGLGGSYGQERLLIAKRKAMGGVPEMQEVVFNQPAAAGSGVGSRSSGRHCRIGVNASERIELNASCWDEEWDDFVLAVKGHVSGGNNDKPFESASVADGIRTLQVVDAVYQSAKQNAPADIDSPLRVCVAD